MIALADRTRAALLRALADTPLAPLVVRRTPRIGVRAALAIGIALTLAATFPALALAVGPILFGIPHVAASLRYLVLRRKPSLLFGGAIVVVAVGILACRVAAASPGAGPLPAQLEIGAGTALFALAALEAARSARSKQRLVRAGLALVVLVVGLGLALQAPFVARLAFVHVHNLGVVALWLLLFRREGALPKLVGAALGLALVALASGVTLPLARSLGGLDAGGVDCAAVGAWLAPSLAPSLALTLVVLHAFTDSVHYAFWLGVVPEEELSGEGTLTFRMTVRGLARDFGRVGLALVVLLALGIAALALADGRVARDAYFVVAGFHGYVEGAALIAVLVGRDDPGVPSAVGTCTP